MVAISCLAFLAASQGFTLKRVYHEGNLPVSTVTVTVHLSSGQLDVKGELMRKVNKTFADGSAEVEHSLTAIKTFFNGQETTASGPSQKDAIWAMRLNANGAPTPDSKSPRGSLIMELLNTGLLGAILPAGEVKVGDTFPILCDEKQGPRLEGKSTLAEVTNGIARITSNITLIRPVSGNKLPLKVTAWVDVATGETSKIEGIADEVPNAPAGAGVQKLSFVVDRKPG